ncbi:hypothetical protein MA16_Dca014624 [Dendrobium catenatum]|uniref:Uncharacterized protein n=1 Tax=Dendrobium catenatum TaxID=906689 RepID=A0A2I0WYR1_9ASPA|nr:hypothetical protein MA16_Dca014624 [Dendrobium catenatum]
MHSISRSQPHLASGVHCPQLAWCPQSASPVNLFGSLHLSTGHPGLRLFDISQVPVSHVGRGCHYYPHWLSSQLKPSRYRMRQRFCCNDLLLGSHGIYKFYAPSRTPT